MVSWKAAIPGALKIKNMADPVRHDRSTRPGGCIPMYIVRVARLARLVVDREVAYKDARQRPRQAYQARSRTLQTLKDDLEELALLRVHIRGLEVVDAEEVVVELANVLVDKVAAGHIGAAAVVAALGVVEAVDVVSPGWNGPLGGLVVNEESP